MTRFNIGDRVRLTPEAKATREFVDGLNDATAVVTGNHEDHPRWLKWLGIKDASGVFGSAILPQYVEHAPTTPTLVFHTTGAATPEAIREAFSERRQSGPTILSEPVRIDPRKPEGGSKGDALAHGERMEEYGHPKVSFDRIGRMWSAYLSAPEVDPDNLTGEDVGHLMMLLKISRSITDKKPDTLDDTEGYISCIRMLRDVAE